MDFVLAQGFVQTTGMLAGLIYVRVMPVEQYAVYALCLTALTVIAVGSDLGLTGSLSYFWRKHASDQAGFAAMVALVRRFRTILLAASSILGSIIFATSIGSVLATGQMLAICLALVVATAWLQSHVGIDTLLLRLSGRQRDSYVIEAAGSSTRLGAAVFMMLTGIGAAWFGLLGGLLGAIVMTALLHRTAASTPPTLAAPEPRHDQALRSYVLPLLPSVLVFIVQDPLVIWLAAVRGGSTTVAEVHALGRIAAIISIISAFSSVVMMPRLARTPDSRRYLTLTLTYTAMLCVLISLSIAIAAAFPATLLLLVGSTYAHLGNELLLSVCTAGLAVLASSLTLANRGQGWTALDAYFAFAQLLTVLGLCWVWEMDSSAQVLKLTLVLYATAFLWPAITMLIGTLNPALVSADVRSRRYDP